jgi:hypothetical protein
MRTRIGLLSIVGLFGLLAAAQAASPFDGTYQLYSATKVNETFVSRGGDMGFCPERRPGAFSVTDGQARYTTETGRNLDAPVAPNGGFEARSVDPDGSGAIRVAGTIDGNGTVRARQIGNSCSYDFVWQKQP